MYKYGDFKFRRNISRAMYSGVFSKSLWTRYPEFRRVLVTVDLEVICSQRCYVVRSRPPIFQENSKDSSPLERY